MTKRSKISEIRRRELNEEVAPLAREFRKSFIRDDEPIKNTFKILESMGFFVLRFPSKDHNLYGFHLKKSGYDCIYINTNNTLGRQYFSAWHEVYHAITGIGEGPSLKNNIKYDENEFRAECFAGNILMPEDLMIKYINKNNINLRYLKYEDVIRIQNFFKVSYTAVLVRLSLIFKSYKPRGFLYSLTSLKNKDKLIEITKNVGGDLSLIEPTKDFTFPKSFVEDIKFNLKNKRISPQKAKQLYELLNESVKEADD